jgi:hypothetical protein
LAGARVIHAMAPTHLTISFATMFDKFSYVLKTDKSK